MADKKLNSKSIFLKVETTLNIEDSKEALTEKCKFLSLELSLEVKHNRNLESQIEILQERINIFQKNMNILQKNMKILQGENELLKAKILVKDSYIRKNKPPKEDPAPKERIEEYEMDDPNV